MSRKVRMVDVCVCVADVYKEPNTSFLGQQPPHVNFEDPPHSPSQTAENATL